MNNSIQYNSCSELLTDYSPKNKLRKELRNKRYRLADSAHNNYLAAVIGAGPAGLYAAQYLARHGVNVVIFNRDIKPGGLAVYGIYPDKHKMRTGLQAHFNRILAMPRVSYLGNLSIGKSGDLTLDQLRQAGFQALMVTTGAQQSSWLGIPGEDLAGVYHANEVVFSYNHLPQFNDNELRFGQKAAVIGMGNVMLDLVNYLRQSKQTRLVTAYGRRGPTEVKFDQPTLEPVANCLDMPAIRLAVEEVMPSVNKIGKDIQDFYSLVENARKKGSECNSDLRFQMKFLRSPRRLVGDDLGHVREIVFEINQLVLDEDQVKIVSTGDLEAVQCDTVIFSIGSQVDAGFGLPVAHGNYVTNPSPRFPVDGISYEVYNPDLCINCEDIFVSGWARQAGEGIVGLARKDAERGAKAVINYLESLGSGSRDPVEDVIEQLPLPDKTVVTKGGLIKLQAAEKVMADKKGLAEFMFSSNEEMLKIIKGN